MSLSCPSCNVALQLGYMSISCPSCHQSGDPAFWSGLIARGRNVAVLNPCAFCQGKTKANGFNERVCTRCGIEYHQQIESRVDRMSVAARARFIGYYHAMNEHPYRWMYEPTDRSTEREYARGWLSAPIRSETSKANRRLWDKEASRDSSMWR